MALQYLSRILRLVHKISNRGAGRPQTRIRHTIRIFTRHCAYQLVPIYARRVSAVSPICITSQTTAIPLLLLSLYNSLAFRAENVISQRQPVGHERRILHILHTHNMWGTYILYRFLRRGIVWVESVLAVAVRTSGYYILLYVRVQSRRGTVIYTHIL